MARTVKNVIDKPQRGDVIQVKERRPCDGVNESFVADLMFRVIAVHEDHLWFKEYGSRYHVTSVKAWANRLRSAELVAMISYSKDAEEAKAAERARAATNAD